MNKQFAVYIMASRPRYGALYTGMSGNLVQRVQQNAGLIQSGATWALRYKTSTLVYYELVDDYERARLREQQIKGWKRAWKLRLIEEKNPLWLDLTPEIEPFLGC